MTTPFFAGLGAALQNLGQTSTQNAYLKSLQDEQAKRDALQQLATMNTIGARPLQPGEDPTQAIQNIVNGNTTAQQMSGHGAVPNTALGGTQKPYMDFGNPYTTTVGNQQVLVNPGQSTAALSDKRYLAAQQEADQRADQRVQAQRDIEQQKTDAAAKLTQQKAQQDAQGDFDYLSAMAQAGSASPATKGLIAKGFNPNNAHAYSQAVEFEKAAYIQAHQYHAPPAQFTFQQGVDENGKPVITRENKVSGAVTPTDVGAVPKTGGLGQGALTPQALEGMHEQAVEADRIMTAFEKKYALSPSGTVGPGSGVLGAGASQQGGGFTSGVGRMLGNIGLSMANPEYQTYIAAQKRFGNIMGNTMSRRYTEHQGTLDTDLSGLQAGDVAPTIALKQTYRRDLIDNFPTKGVAAPQAQSKDPEFDALMSQLKKP